MPKFLCILFISISFTSWAQERTDTVQQSTFDSPSRYDQRYQMAFVVSEMLIANFTAEGYYNFNENHGIGIRLTAPGMPADQDDNVIYKALRYGYGAGLMHRVYFPTSDFKTRYYFIRTGLHYSQANLIYYDYDFFAETDNFGNEVLIYGPRRANETVLRTSFDFALGYQAYYSSGLFLEFTLGLKRSYIVNRNQLHEEAQLRSEDTSPFDRWLYQGVNPTIGFSLGFGNK